MCWQILKGYAESVPLIFTYLIRGIDNLGS